MSRETGIEWTDATWNPIRGCSRVSEGCRHCYAELVANRFCGPGSPYEGVVQIDADGKGNGKWNGQIKFVEKHLLDPLRWKPGVLVPCPQCGDPDDSPCYPLDNGHRPGTTGRPKRIFVNSMSDLFHENVTDAMLDQIFAVMALCPQHTFQVLTKRPERMLAYLTARTASRWPLEVAICTMLKDRPSKSLAAAAERTSAVVDAAAPDGSGFVRVWPLPNVWLGVSVEDQKAADVRIPLLLQTPAAVRFISAEPLLGAVDLENLPSHSGIGRYLDSLSNFIDHGADIAARLDWVIVGGESGSVADVRPMHPDWARGLRDQCVAAGVPFFFKQWGEWVKPDLPEPTDIWLSPKGIIRGNDLVHGDQFMRRVGKKAAGRLLDGVEWNQMPEVRA